MALGRAPGTELVFCLVLIQHYVAVSGTNAALRKACHACVCIYVEAVVRARKAHYACVLVCISLVWSL